MNRKLTGIAAALVLALVGTLVLVGYVRSAEARALSGEELVTVLVVTKTIEAGTAADELVGHVKAEQVPSKVRATGAVASLDDIEGKVASVDLLPGEQLMTERFVSSVTRSQAGVPSGLLEVTIALDPERALGGNLRTGDTVGVVASFDDAGDGKAASHLMLHKVLVSNVQLAELSKVDEDEAAGQGAVAPSGKLLVTLAVDAPAVERIVFAAEHGRVWLTAEPAEAATTGTSIITKASVFA
jgi:pilus assembly protein CpaB